MPRRVPTRALALTASVVAAAGLTATAAASTAAASASPSSASHPLVVSSASQYQQALHSPDWVRTPAGLEHKGCVTHLPTGARLAGKTIHLASGATRALPTCNYPRIVKPGSQAAIASKASGPVPTTNGWMVASWWGAPTWLTGLSSSFTVPSAPVTTGATDFFFPSFEPSNGSAIIQPVLSFGGSAAGGGNYWYITSWYVSGNQTLYGNNVQVNVGDTIAGTMSSTGCAGDGTNCQWTIVTRDDSAGGAQSTLNVQTPESYSTAQGGVLESYGASQCSMLPQSGHIPFTGLSFRDSSGNSVSPSFGAFTPDTECGASVNYTNSTTDINWSSS